MLHVLSRRGLAATSCRLARYATASQPPSLLEQCSGLPLIAGQVEGAGRGLFALVDLPAARTLATFSPVAAHPPHNRDDVCHACLRSLPASHVTHAATGKRLCSAACEQDAERRYLSAQASAADKLADFERRCAERDAIHPMLAARFALSVVQQAEHPAALDALCYARGAVEAPPAEWVAEHTLLARAFAHAGLASDFFTPQWYVGVLARLHLNVFRVDVMRTDVTDIASLARFAAEGNGTAVYALPSLINHDCDPCVDATWPSGDARMTLSTRRAMAAGEELRITYIDSSEPVAKRRSDLRFAYGFLCSCAACVEEAADS